MPPPYFDPRWYWGPVPCNWQEHKSQLRRRKISVNIHISQGSLWELGPQFCHSVLELSVKFHRHIILALDTTILVSENTLWVVHIQSGYWQAPNGTCVMYPE